MLQAGFMRTVVVIPGDGIGPEIMAAALRVLEALSAPLSFVQKDIPQEGRDKPFARDLVDAIKKHGVVLKGPLATPTGGGYQSLNVRLRNKFGLFANVRPVKAIRGVPATCPGANLVIIRENLEGLYSGIEFPAGEARDFIQHPALPKTAAASVSIATREECERIAVFAFQYAVAHQRKKITIVHKANILKETSGLFLKTAQTVSKRFPSVQCDDLLADNLAHLLAKDLASRPERFDVLLCDNHYGDLFSDLAAGFTGGLGLAPSAQFGESVAIFEAVHGTAPDIAGKGIANPTALMLSAAMLLEYIGRAAEVERVRRAIVTVYQKGKVRTADLGGSATTEEFTDALIGTL